VAAIAAAGSVHGQTGPEDDVLHSVRGSYDANRLVIDAVYMTAPNFDGAWDFQVFLDTDQHAETGYAHGYDLVVRGVVALNQPVPLHGTLAGNGPGGWGLPVGIGSAVMLDARHLRITLAYGESGLSQGAVRFAFETYLGGVLTSSVRDRFSVAVDGYLPLDCNANGIADDRDIATGFSKDCSGNGVPDECEPDCDSDGTPDVCAILADPTIDCDGDGVPSRCESFARAAGGRYIAVKPHAGATPVALLIRGHADDSSVACVEAYVQPDGTLASRPHFALPEAWCKVHVTGTEILPGRSYVVYEDHGTLGRQKLSEGVTVTTWLNADTNRDQVVDFSDITRVVQGFLGPFTPDLTLWMVDLVPDSGTRCRPDRLVSFKDVSEAVDAFITSKPYTTCPVPCP